ncbi:MAG: leucyl aminopeptidase [Candidatus Doudnabacteria bacterium CG10_big_fil_rev_8_21_14_0_10_41_10]|uniref:Probable cytosol aminopeptidase n=1 Tax=Candidatus Doudnabacteria bacterium CG10_big_fil_rev_8_21_14_0_10_41_10 TaxID=1974551 RepID=A0A2H0VC22_9BACT|nr:MAG: leucyl aminopeptidase [Candidatus Doudnabacteria bacterium CG10_big_fil_rev_8_21_14_0_10_41_10]
MTNFSASTQSPTQIKSDLMIVRIFEGEKTLEPKVKELDKTLRGAISNIIKTGDFTGKKGEAQLVYTHQATPTSRILLLGLGKKTAYNLESSRIAMSTVTTVIQKVKAGSISVLLTKTLPKKSNTEQAIQVIMESLFLSNYKFLEHKKIEVGDEPVILDNIEFVLNKAGDKASVLKGAKQGCFVAAAVNFARDLANHPGNFMTPQSLAEAAIKMAKENKIKYKVLEKPEMKKLGMGALLGVNQGSILEPKFIILEYNLSKPGKPTVLVGKGITFDSGGISIKPSQKMNEMKFDMCGAATVLGVMKAAAELKLPHKLIGLIPATENLPSGSAIKPGDVVRAMNGKSIEINNTDAEGRIILADALSYAQKYKPKNVIDFATLTGAAIVALGTGYSAAFGNNEQLMARLQKAAEISGEKIWRLPLDSDYKEKMKGKIADLDNIGHNEGGGTITAALFLQEFVDFPWIHLDIAGTAWTNEPKPYRPVGATGVGVRLTLEFLK